MTDLDHLIRLDEYEKIAAVDAIESQHPPVEVLDTLAATIAAEPEQSIPAACSTRFRAAHNSGTRPLRAVRWIVMHDTEGSTAAGAAAWFQNPASQGSAHIVVDNTICYRTLPNSYIPWGAQGANYRGFHIEQAGFASWSGAMWNGPKRQTLQRAAYKAALHCRLFNIPPWFRWAKSLEKGQAGITTHAECTKAFGGNHTDPGTGWPRFTFMVMVRSYYESPALRKVKPVSTPETNIVWGD